MTASASAPAQRSGVIAPYGGTLVDLMVAEVDRAAVKATATKTIECSDRNACDVELLCIGGFSPLRGFMHQEDYDAVVSGHRLAAGQLFGLPIVMDTDRDDVVVGDKLLLTYKGQDLAVLEVEDKWEPNKVTEAKGCYGTTSALAVGPLVKAGLIEPTGIVGDAASGVSGAGRPPKPNTTFCAVDEDFTAYGLLDHRHTPEIEMAIGRHADTDVQVLFTPHLAPMNRGILATCYARPTGSISTDDAMACLHAAYADEPFVVVSERSPSTKATLGSNSCHVTARVDERTGWLIVIAALDNLVKGASGQAVQCANLALGLPETTGLTAAGMYP